MSIHVDLGGATVEVERAVFAALLDTSVVSGRKPYVKALESSRISFDKLVTLARAAEIPYTLFFAPLPVVEAQVERKLNTLLQGISKDTFSMNSRSRVELRDIELIVKDLLRKQELIKSLDTTLTNNAVVGCLKGSRAGIVDDADKLRAVLGFSVSDVKTARSKEDAFEILVRRFETQQLLVSQSQQNFMPQRIPQGVKFSGLCIKDRKVPYLFLTGGDAGANPEPVGRRIFTLVLLAVLVARGRFTPVTYDDFTSEAIAAREYEIAEEVLMPAEEVGGVTLASLESIKACANVYRVTPSAVVMRARRLGLLTRDDALGYLAELRAEFAVREKPPARQPKTVNAVRKYNGVEYSRRLLHQVELGRLSPSEFCRVVSLNKLKPSQINELRATL